MQPALSPGDVIRVRGREWILHAVTAYAGCRELDLEAADARDRRGDAMRGRLTLLDPFDRPASTVLPRPTASASSSLVSP